MVPTENSHDIYAASDVQRPRITSSSSIHVTDIDQFSFAHNEGYTKERSSLMVIGISFHTALVDIHEKLSIPEAQLLQAISDRMDV
ncbi:hypothetical protein Tco_0379384 [Tanacetum coccineum]